MGAYSDQFPWPSFYGNYNFFESRMVNHDRVASLEVESAGVYVVKRVDGSSLRVFICECYSYGVAEYLETVQNIGEVDAVVINSSWCGYTGDVKSFCRDKKVGVFDIGEFMGALSWKKFWEYYVEK